MFRLACGGKRSKLLFNIIKIIIISFTYANPGRKKRAFQNTKNKTLSQTVRLPCDFSCDYKWAQENNPNCRKIMTLFNADALSAHPFCQFFPAYCFSLSIVLLLASVLKLLENGFPPAVEPPTDTHTPPSWGSKLRVPNWISALQEHRVIGINCCQRTPGRPGSGHAGLGIILVSPHSHFGALAGLKAWVCLFNEVCCWNNNFFLQCEL